jgi:quercetin dioxygenase-like cupin family protein
MLERKWQPTLVLDTHTHPFAVKALVVQGEMWLVVGNDEQHLLPGDAFVLERGVCPTSSVAARKAPRIG